MTIPDPTAQAALFARYATTADLATEPKYKYYGRSFAKGTILFVPIRVAKRYVRRGRLALVAGTQQSSDIVIVNNRRWLNRYEIMQDNTAGAAQVALRPTITQVSPASGLISGGFTVTLTGTHFTGATGATVGGAAATNFAVVSPTSVTFTVPAHAAGALDLVLLHPTGNLTVAGAITLAAAPTVAGVGPSTGTTAGGDSISIHGTGLTGATGATLDGVAVTSFVVVSATQITCRTAAHSAGAVALVVQHPLGNVTVANAFTYA